MPDSETNHREIQISELQPCCLCCEYGSCFWSPLTWLFHPYSRCPNYPDAKPHGLCDRFVRRKGW